MSGKPRFEEVIVVEGKYDAAKLSALVDAMVLPVGGFSVFTSAETKALVRQLGQKRGLIILTDSDAAGFRIRAYLNQVARGLPVKNAYVPAVAGKEKRKDKPSKEGLLGVEGVDCLLYTSHRQRKDLRGPARHHPRDAHQGGQRDGRHGPVRRKVRRHGARGGRVGLVHRVLRRHPRVCLLYTSRCV